MTVVLDATIGGATANSYNTEAALDTVADELLPAPCAWLDSPEGSDLRMRAAVAATRRLDLERYVASRVDETQVLEWPRELVRKPEIGTYPGSRMGFYGYYLPTEIPWAITRSHALLTFFLIDAASNGIDPFAAPDEAGLQSMQLGYQVNVAFEPGSTAITPGDRFMASVIYPVLAQYGLVYSNQPMTVRG